LPHLVLYRNDNLTDPAERTLVVAIDRIEVPPAGVTVTLTLTTQHRDPDRSGFAASPILVWRESRFLSNTVALTQAGAAVVFHIEFGAVVLSGTEEIATPTDYYHYDLRVKDGASNKLLHAFSGDHAFLLENQWIAPLPKVREAAPGAAPNELIVYYCDMFPFRWGAEDPATWVPRQEIPAYVGGDLVPAMVEAFRTQTDDWGFAWYPAWTSYRTGPDSRRLSVALGDGATWFHGRAPSIGSAGISINVNSGFNTYYGSLTEGIMSTFHHELFHNQQRNIEQHYRGRGTVSGKDGAWAFFAEGTAVLASAVGQPTVELSSTTGLRAYMTRVNLFLGEGRRAGELNRSYEEMFPYYAAIYWRFLYEQCGGIRDGLEDPAAGMATIRRVLAVLYSGNVVNTHSSTDLVKLLPKVMDQALAGSNCPFQDYKESLIAFSGAIYLLGLDGSRYEESVDLAPCGFYDPHNLYPAPPRDTFSYAGGPLTYDQAHQATPAGIPSSYGIDLLEVVLTPALDGQTLTIEFSSDPGVEFVVQVWLLADPAGSGQPPAICAPMRLRGTSNGSQVYTIKRVELDSFDRLGLAITRVDAKEESNPAGAYTLQLTSSW
jgi:hypothetical protein